MSRGKDTLAVLRGLQLVTKASLKSNEEYVRHLWANSSVRDVIRGNCERAKQFVDKITTSPSEEFEHVASILKETVDRSSLVAESLYHYGLSQSVTLEKINEMSKKPRKVVDTVTNAGQLDISAITLKELEHYLSNQTIRRHNEKSNSNTAQTNSSEPNMQFHSTDVPKQMLNDEKYVKEWMQFIAQHKPNTSEPKSLSKNSGGDTTKISSEIKSDMDDTTEPVKEVQFPELSKIAKQRKVPSSRIGRMASFGTLFAGLGIGTINELAKGALGLGGSTDAKSALFSEKNAERIVDTLCRVRGAALKLGQILSIQDSAIVSPHLVKAFDRVRQAADYMPDWQVEKVMKRDFGKDWQSKFKTFEKRPFAAASIGQVHQAVLHDELQVALKIQYPGVAQSIESDIDNLVGMLKIWNVFPPGIFIDNIVKVAKRELVWEVDYLREANYTEKYGEMIAKYEEYRVPNVIRDLTTINVLTTELVPGVPLDKCFELR